MRLLPTILLLVLIGATHAQKRLRLVVYQVDAGVSDCDPGFFEGDSDWVMSWDDGPTGFIDECYGFGGNDNPPVTGVNIAIYDRSITCATDWPTGFISYNLQGDEADGLEGDCSDDYSTGQSWAYPGTTNGTFLLNGGNWNTLTINECSGGDFVRYRARWEVSGSFTSVPPNDDICSADDFGTIGGGFTSGWITWDNDCATLQGGEPRPQDDVNSVWYRFTTPVGGLVDVTARMEQVTSSDNTALTIYRATAGCSFGGLVNIVSDYGCVNGFTEIEASCLPGGTTYYVQASTQSCALDAGETGTYRFRLTANPYDAGPDDFCDATAEGTISGLTGTLSINDRSNECAGTEPGEPGGGQNTVWFTVQTGSTVGYDLDVTMDAETNGLNSDIYIYEVCGTDCIGSSPQWSNLVEIDNFFDVNPLPGAFDAGGTISGRIRPNSTYWIRADGTSTVGTTGGFDIDLAFGGGAYQANDDLCDAQTIGTLPVDASTTVSGNIDRSSSEDRCALDEPNEDEDQTTVWYRYNTGSSPGNTLGFDVDFGVGCSPDLHVYTGPSSLSGCPFTPGTNGFSQLSFLGGGGVNGFYEVECPAPNTTYYLQVDEDGLCSGSFTLEVTNGVETFTNDVCTQAIPLGTITPGGTIGSAASSWNNFCMGGAGESVSCSYGIDQGAWFSFSTPATGFSGTVDIEAYNDPTGRGDGIDLQIAVFSGSCGSLTEVDCEYDPGFSSESLTDVCLEPSTTYYILIDGGPLFGGVEGWFGLEVIDQGPYPANDLPCDADLITTQPENVYTTSTASGSNVGGTDCNEPDPGWTLNGNESGVWYRLNAPGRHLIIDANSLPGDNIDLKLALYEGPCGDASTMTPNYVDRDYDAGTFDEDIFFSCLDPTATYYLIVDGSFINQQGDFDLSVLYPYEGGRTTCTTGPNPARAIGTVPDGGNVSYVNTANFCGLNATDLAASGGPATVPAPPFTVDQAVWYTFRPPSSGSVRINADSDPVIGPSLGVGSGDEINLEMAVYESADGSCQPPSWSLIDVASYSNGTLSYDEEMIVNCLDPGKDYWLLVDGEFDATLLAGGTEGYFEITLEDYGLVTTNDLACDAIPFTTDPATLAAWETCNSSLTVTLGGQNNYCANNINEPSPSAWTPLPATAQPVWYSFVAPPSGRLDIELNTTTSLPWRQDYFNGKLAVYDLPDGADICTYFFGPADEVASDYDLDIPPASTGEDMTVECLEPGRTYYLMVDGKETALYPEWFRGEFSLDFIADPRDQPAPNDSICEAKDLGDPTGGTVGTDVDDASLLNSPPRDPGDPFACMRAENSFCATDADNPALNGFTLWGFDNTVWYSFTGPVSGAVRIEVDGDVGVDGDEFAPQVVVYESSDGTCAGTLFDLEAAPTISSGFATSVSVDANCLNTGQTYFIAVDGGPLALELGDIDGYFEVSVTEITPTEFPPSHNDICDAKVIDPFASAVSISNDTNRCANREFAIPDPSTFTRDNTVWYTFTTPAGTGPYAVEIDVNSQLGWPFGDAMDPQIAVYQSSDGTCTGTVTEHFSDYSVVGLPLTENAEVHCLDVATTYWIMIDGSGINTQGFFDITVQQIAPNPVAPNDDVCAPTDLGTLGAAPGSSVGGTTIDRGNFCASVASGEADPDAFDLDQTVWFTFTTPALASGDGVNVDIDVLNDPNGLGDQIDAQVALWQSFDQTCTGAFTELESGYNPLGFSEALNDVCLRPATTYFVQVDGSALNTQGYFTIEVVNDGITGRPANDDFCAAQSLALGAVTPGQNDCATLETGEPNAGVDVQKSVWYSFVAPPSGRVEIRTIDADGALSGIDPEWHLHDFTGGCEAGGFTGVFDELASAYVPTLGVTNPDDVADYECLVPGRTYYIQVDGTTVGGPEGAFEILVSDLLPDYGTLPGPPTSGDPEPENNTCDQAEVLTVGTESCLYGAGSFQTENYGLPTRTVDEIACAANCGETWYRFTMPATGFAKIEGDDEYGTLGTTNSDLVVAAYRGGCGSLALIECGVGGAGADVDFSVSGTPGETIWLQVFDGDGDEQDRDFGLCVSERCAADDCEDALTAPDILGLGDQCFDVRDATGEDIAGGEAGYGVGGVFSDDPGHSVYYAFETDDFCWAYALNLQTADVGTVGGLGGQELILTVYEDDGTPCDHDPSGEPVLDIQTFDQGTYPSGVNYDVTYFVGGTNGIQPNTRYIIQIEGNASTVDGTIRIEKLCEGREWATPTAPVTTSDAYCFDGTWRHYLDDAGTPADPDDDILLFSLRPNGNVFDGVATVTVDPAMGFAEDPGVEASWTMRRYWDFEVTSGSIVQPVDVRFYYTDAEKQEVIDAAIEYRDVLYPAAGLVYEPFEWFKSEDGVVFDPALHVNPATIEAGYGSGSGPTITGSPVVQTTSVGVTVVAQDYDAAPTNAFCNGVRYVEYQGLTAFSGGTGGVGVGPGGSPLPVELLRFTGRVTDTANVLDWATAAELDNSHFEVQHSTDGLVFETIGIVDGMGTTSSLTTYDFPHHDVPAGWNHYRLVQVDLDGDRERSHIVTLDNRSDEPSESMVLMLYPNPTARNTIDMDVYVHTGGPFRIEVIDLTGRVVRSEDVVLEHGYITRSVDLGEVANGAYVLELIDLRTMERVQKRFVRTD